MVVWGGGQGIALVASAHVEQRGANYSSGELWDSCSRCSRLLCYPARLLGGCGGGGSQTQQWHQTRGSAPAQRAPAHGRLLPHESPVVAEEELSLALATFASSH